LFWRIGSSVSEWSLRTIGLRRENCFDQVVALRTYVNGCGDDACWPPKSSIPALFGSAARVCPVRGDGVATVGIGVARTARLELPGCSTRPASCARPFVSLHPAVFKST